MFADILKERTLVAHASLEKKLIVHIKRIRSTTDYVDLLMLLYPFHFHSSQLLDSFTIQLPEARSDLARAQNIQADLEHFGVAIQGQTFEIPEMQPVNSLEDALGIIYVLEGSTMGGQIITRILSNAMQVSPDKGFSFFNPYQSNTHSNWEKFRSQLNLVAEELHQQRIINSANSFFNSYNQWIQLHEPARN